MNFEITSGKIPTAIKCCVYGPEGIGKSTFASKFPDPLFIDTEGSTKQLSVKRLPAPKDFNELLEDRISHELDESPVLELECSNHPCTILAEIAEEVAIDESTFPAQCIMVVSRNGVRIKDGTNEPWLELFPDHEYY